MSHQKKNEEQTDIEIMKSRKMIELIEKAVSRKKDEIIRQQQIAQRKTDREFLSSYLYDKGEEVLDIAEAQFPIQTRMILGKIVELIKSREIKNRISGRELLALFRSIGVKVRIIQPWPYSMTDWRFPVLADIDRENKTATLRHG
jgi:hypothetical protein